MGMSMYNGWLFVGTMEQAELLFELVLVQARSADAAVLTRCWFRWRK